MGRKLSFTRAAEKDLAKLPKKDIKSILDACSALEVSEANLNIKKLHPPLHGFRLRVGRYRVLYVIEGSDTITVHAIKQRKDAYK